MSLRYIAGSGYRADWKKFPLWLIQQASLAINQPVDYQGTRVYLSYNPRKTHDKKFLDWSTQFLNRQPGIDVFTFERKFRRAPICPSCQSVLTNCPICGGGLDGMIEKGVDTAIVTDLISLAWEDACKIAILVSSDRDFIPAVEMLDRKGFHVINAHFKPHGMELSPKCWASIVMASGLKDYQLD